jgi:hypothetical protein
MVDPYVKVVNLYRDLSNADLGLTQVMNILIISHSILKQKQKRHTINAVLIKTSRNSAASGKFSDLCWIDCS